MAKLLLAQNLLVKFCHDLSGCLTAVRSGSEFLDDQNQETVVKAKDLVKSSAKQTIARLEFFRSAYGSQKRDGEANLEEIRSIAKALLANSKIDLDFRTCYSHKPNIFICANTGKLILCMIYIASNVILYGGKVFVEIEKADNNITISVLATGRKIKYLTEKNTILCGNIENLELTPFNVHYYYTLMIMEEIGYSMEIDATDSSITYKATRYTKSQPE